LTRQRWYAAHRSHAYQHAAVLLVSHKAVTLVVLMINGFWLLPLAAMAYRWPQLELWLLMIAYAPLVWLAFRLEAGKINLSGAGT
jgi:Fuc2NAc and GlcNAc transferase